MTNSTILLFTFLCTVATGFIFLGLWLKIAKNPVPNARTPYKLGLCYHINKILFAVFLVITFLGVFWELSMINIMWITIVVVAIRASWASNSVHSPDPNHVTLIRNTTFSKHTPGDKNSSRGIEIYRIAYPGLNWLVSGDEADTENQIDLADKAVRTIGPIRVDLKDGRGSVMVKFQYITIPFLEHLQEQMNVSGNNKETREQTLENIFDARMEIAIKKYFSEKERDDVISAENTITEDLRRELRNRPNYLIEEVSNGEKLLDIQVIDVADTAEAANANEQYVVVDRNADNTLHYFRKLYKRDPVLPGEEGYDEKVHGNDMELLHGCQRDVMAFDNESQVFDVRGLEGIKSADTRAHVFSNATHMMKGKKS
jgi:hypothetical protein